MGLVRHTVESDEDAIKIWDYIALDDMDAADRFIFRIESLLQTLSDAPDIGRLRNEIENGLRSFPIDNYVVYYKPLDGGIKVARILNAKQDVGGQLESSALTAPGPGAMLDSTGESRMKNIEISDASGELLERLLESGDFKDEQEVVEVSLRLCKTMGEMRLEEERRLVKEGIAEYRAGNYAPWDSEEVKQLGRKLLRERSQSHTNQ